VLIELYPSRAESYGSHIAIAVCYQKVV